MLHNNNSKCSVWVCSNKTYVLTIEVDYYITLEDLLPSFLVATFFSMCVYDPHMFKSNQIYIVRSAIFLHIRIRQKLGRDGVPLMQKFYGIF